MSIASGFEKIKDRILTSAGYKLRSLWTSAQTVEMDDGTYLQDKIESMDATINGKAPSSHTHSVSQVTGLTGSRALVSDSSGHPAVSAVTSTELGYLDGAKSNIQSQINTLNSNLENIGEEVAGLNGNLENIFVVRGKDNVDYNTLTAGIHYCGTGCLNAPEGYCRVICLYSYKNPGTDSIQLAFSVSTPAIYRRKMGNDGLWGDWRKITFDAII